MLQATLYRAIQTLHERKEVLDRAIAALEQVQQTGQDLVPEGAKSKGRKSMTAGASAQS